MDVKNVMAHFKVSSSRIWLKAEGKPMKSWTRIGGYQTKRQNLKLQNSK
jgi:hypothetical protein